MTILLAGLSVWDVLPPRIVAKIYPEPMSGCWLWGASTNQNGYGAAYIGPDRHTAHKLIYELLIGPVPEGLELDHGCRVRCCVNPWHLEPVTHAVNMARAILPSEYPSRRRPLCPRGHAKDEVLPDGSASCSTCRRAFRRERVRRFRLRQRDSMARASGARL